MLEVAFRASDALRGERRVAAQTELEWGRIVDTIHSRLPELGGGDAGQQSPGSAGVVLHPYVAFDWRPVTEQIGKEVAYFESSESDANLEILIIGSSVAAGFGHHAVKHLLELVATTPEFAGRQVKVMRHGHGGYKQPQQALLFTYMLGLGYQPDVVINIDGFNELTLGVENVRRGAHPLHPSVGHWAHLRTASDLSHSDVDQLLAIRAEQRDAQSELDRALAWNLAHSAAASRWVTRRLRGIQADCAREQAAYTATQTGATDVSLRGPPFSGDASAAVELSVRNWAECTRSIAALCAARSIRYVHVLQPTLHDPGSKPVTQAEQRSGALREEWIEAVRIGYPLLREEGELLRQDGVDFVDASRIFQSVSDTLYYDGCHFVPAGYKLMAQAVAQVLSQPRPPFAPRRKGESGAGTGPQRAR